MHSTVKGQHVTQFPLLIGCKNSSFYLVKAPFSAPSGTQVSYIGDFDVRDREPGYQMEMYNREVIWKLIAVQRPAAALLSKAFGETKQQDMYLSNEVKHLEYNYRAGSTLCTRFYKERSCPILVSNCTMT